MRESVRKKLPEIKKDIRQFVSDESGFVSKDSILKVGIALGAASLLLANAARADAPLHTNGISSASFNSATYTLSGQHSHHGNHGNY
jgi:hypothetical protein